MQLPHFTNQKSTIINHQSSIDLALLRAFQDPQIPPRTDKIGLSVPLLVTL